MLHPYEKDPQGQCVYEATCKNCGKRYVGETGLLLETRKKSHASSKNSALKNHNCSDVSSKSSDLHLFEFAQIGKCHNTNRRKIFESIEIQERKPELNENNGVFSYIYF